MLHIFFDAPSLLLQCCRHILHTISSLPYKSLKKPLIKLLVNNPATIQYIRELEYEVHHDDNHIQFILLVEIFEVVIRGMFGLAMVFAVEQGDWVQIR